MEFYIVQVFDIEWFLSCLMKVFLWVFTITALFVQQMIYWYKTPKVLYICPIFD